MFDVVRRCWKSARDPLTQNAVVVVDVHGVAPGTGAAVHTEGRRLPTAQHAQRGPVPLTGSARR